MVKPLYVEAYSALLVTNKTLINVDADWQSRRAIHASIGCHWVMLRSFNSNARMQAMHWHLLVSVTMHHCLYSELLLFSAPCLKV